MSKQDWRKLKEYESLGLSLDRLRELAEADKDERVVILPVKIGDPVWFIAAPCDGCDGYEKPVTEESIIICAECKKMQVIELPFELEMVTDLGKWVFSLKEEAEREMERRKAE